MGLPMLNALRDMGANARGLDVVDVADPYVTTDDAAFATELETLLVVVRDANQTQQVLFDQQNLVARAPHLSRVVLCSTVSPRFITALAEALPDHIVLIDAAISGAQHGAISRELTFMLGGPDDEVDAIVPILSAMGSAFFHMGPLGSGMQAKVLNNLLAASHTAVTRLALEWAERTGIDQDVLLQLIAQSSGQNWLSSGFDTIEFARDGYAPDNSIGLLVKDVACAIDAAPPNAELVLPQTIMTALRQLRPMR
jgi:3-hydroxyisobutyrate dehydrogenase-like beta-hydroxyacid dehydrogenase